MLAARRDFPTVFSPNDAGTPELTWTDFLKAFPHWAPQTRDVVVVAPHPDDEVLGAGGLIRTCAADGRRVSVISVTDGEAAYAHAEDLGLVRRSELVNALRVLCPMHIEVERLGIPDGRVTHYQNRVRNALRDRLSDSCTIIAPYEHDGHPDHDVVGQVCMRLAAVYGVQVARYPIWTWHHAEPALMSGHRWGIFPLCPEARRAKARAIQRFESQLRPPRAEPILPLHVIAHFERRFEAFVL